MKYGATFAVAVAGRPSTWISERPVAVPCAWLMVKRTHVTVFGGNVTGRTLPFGGSAPTLMLVPSLKDSVPARMFSAQCGRSYRLTCAIETEEGQPSWIHAPESSFKVTHSRAGSCGAPSMMPSIDRKSTRLNSSHLVISYAVFCLKKKKPNMYYHTSFTLSLQAWANSIHANCLQSPYTHNARLMSYRHRPTQRRIAHLRV